MRIIRIWKKESDEQSKKIRSPDIFRKHFFNKTMVTITHTHTRPHQHSQHIFLDHLFVLTYKIDDCTVGYFIISFIKRSVHLDPRCVYMGWLCIYGWNMYAIRCICSHKEETNHAILLQPIIEFRTSHPLSNSFVVRIFDLCRYVCFGFVRCIFFPLRCFRCYVHSAAIKHQSGNRHANNM